jgi:hypothetical protein
MRLAWSFELFPIFLTSQFISFPRPTRDFVLPGFFEAVGPIPMALEKIINDIDQVADIHFRGRQRSLASRQKATPKELR